MSESSQSSDNSDEDLLSLSDSDDDHQWYNYSESQIESVVRCAKYHLLRPKTSPKPNGSGTEGTSTSIDLHGHSSSSSLGHAGDLSEPPARDALTLETGMTKSTIMPVISDSDDDEGFVTSSQEQTEQNRRVDDIEITLSDDDEPVNEENTGNSLSNTTASITTPDAELREEEADQNSPGASTSYRLRRKRKINYDEIENGLEEEELGKDRSKGKKDILDVFDLSLSKLAKCTRNPDLIDNYTKCKIVFMHGTDSSRLNAVVKFFQKCGQQFQSLFIQIRADQESYTFLKNVLKCTSSLTKLDYRYQNPEDAYLLLQLLKDVSNSNGLPSLTSLKLISVSGSECLRDKHLILLTEMSFKFQSVELGDALWEDVKAATIEKFLENQKSTLATFIINGGFRGDTDKEKILITLPKMEALKTLHICPKYAFISEFKNPYSKKARVVNVDVFGHEEPYKVAIKFTCDLPNLKRLVLGNLIEIEDLVFSSVRKLVEFRCGSYWNLSIKFPGDGSRKSLMESSVTEFQFPDALKDPTFAVTVAKHFPNIKKVWLNLPSVPVLRAFFKAFENSQVEELYLKTQFDFGNIMESCLLPNMHDVLRKSQETESLLGTLKEYKHFDEYIRYYNVELPVEAEDLMEEHSAGIGALKNLKVLHLEHIPRQLLIPIPDDERKWYDHNCKFMSTTFGYKAYPLNRKCHQEILKLDLREYIWKNIQISNRDAEEFYVAGFVDVPDVQILCEVHNSSYSDEEEDIFTPIYKSNQKGPHVKVMPSMLLPSFKAKPEDD